jgi:hydroxyacylglutathione hydrolase
MLDIKKKINSGIPTLPTTLKDELECNIFLRTNDIEGFSKLRDLKDNF